ncbi:MULTISPECIES: hypothetical protein [unclassified Roseobacter]|uniref:hypothetical protein n=1 Tax=unclassified Roseobacter TaxID=196798 RepID=UPI0014930F3D|nr:MULTISPECIES: hypothetical protein [unclassified Roseobacter]NNW55473.1 hypothetical protein [Roseobacter sp. HKCCD8284]NNY17286.1 hypothetical protein [Roseobacter sp. HKCCD8191]
MTNKPWWWPQRVDQEWLQRLRQDYPDKADWSDDSLIDYFNDGRMKFSDTWDHLGDARDEYEKLASAFLDLVEKHGLSPSDFNN